MATCDECNFIGTTGEAKTHTIRTGHSTRAGYVTFTATPEERAEIAASRQVEMAKILLATTEAGGPTADRRGPDTSRLDRIGGGMRAFFLSLLVSVILAAVVEQLAFPAAGGPGFLAVYIPSQILFLLAIFLLGGQRKP